MSAMDMWDDDTFIQMMGEAISEQEMADEAAAQEAMTDYQTLSHSLPVR